MTTSQRNGLNKGGKSVYVYACMCVHTFLFWELCEVNS